MRHLINILIIGYIASAAFSAEPRRSTTKPASRPVTPNQAFIRDKLAELDGFHGSKEFREKGFRQGSPFRKWYDAVEAEREATKKKKDEPESNVAILDRLHDLAIEYATTHGDENGKTTQLHKDLTRWVSEGVYIQRPEWTPIGPPPERNPVKRGAN